MFSLCVLVGIPAYSVNLAGCRYEGICTLPGDLVDNWATIELDGEDAEFDFGGQMNFMSPYKVTGTGKNLTLTSTIPGGIKWILQSKDGGDTFEGSLPFGGQTIKTWLLNVPAKRVPATQDETSLKEIISSNDGYTSFIKIYKPDGGVACITGDFNFGENDSFSIKCDSELVQNIFSNLSGTYKVEKDKIVLIDNQGTVLHGSIYSDGTYIVIPLGQNGSKRLEMILIR